MKKFFYSMAMAAMVAGAPMTMVSCNEDDVNTILEIISLFTNTNELAGTTWDSNDDKDRLVLDFTSATSGNLYDYTKMDNDDMVAQSFTYTLDATNNVITINLSSGTRRYTVKSFTKGSSLVLTYNGKTYNMTPYRG
jgi:Ca2+-binding RTX toxin-like protein